LWVSDKPTHSSLWQNNQIVPQPAVKLIQFGNDTNWKSVIQDYGLNAMFLLKTDGTLWRWGTNRSDRRLADIKPHRISDESDWAEIISTDFGLFAWEKDGRAWRFNSQTKDTQNPKMSLDAEVVMERWENFDKVKWRSQGGFMFFRLGIRQDGTLWTFVGEPLNGAYALGESVPKAPMQIGNATNWISVAGANGMLIALKADGSLWKWELGSWGYGKEWPMARPPKRLGIHNDWVAIGGAMYGNGIVSLAGDGSLWHWSSQANYSSLLAPTRKPTEIENIFDEDK
jgi:alpha-tubulin suppressor-like RCC1 family protein